MLYFINRLIVIEGEVYFLNIVCLFVVFFFFFFFFVFVLFFFVVVVGVAYNHYVLQLLNTFSSNIYYYLIITTIKYNTHNIHNHNISLTPLFHILYFYIFSQFRPIYLISTLLPNIHTHPLTMISYQHFNYRLYI